MCLTRGDFLPSIFASSLSFVSMGPCSLLSYQVNFVRGCLLSLSFCTPCWLFGSLGVGPSFLFPELPPSACGHLTFRLCVSCFSPSPSSFPRSSRLAIMLVHLVCAAACDLLPFPTSSRPLPFRSSSLRVPMVMPYSRFSSLPVPVLCVRLPSSSFVCLVSSRSS